MCQYLKSTAVNTLKQAAETFPPRPSLPRSVLDAVGVTDVKSRPWKEETEIGWRYACRPTDTALRIRADPVCLIQTLLGRRRKDVYNGCQEWELRLMGAQPTFWRGRLCNTRPLAVRRPLTLAHIGLIGFYFLSHPCSVSSTRRKWVPVWHLLMSIKLQTRWCSPAGCKK